MNTNKLKLLAVIFMVMDHLAKVLLRSFPVLDRFSSSLITMMLIAGRMSFTLFAFLIANGLRKTHSVRNYLIRLGAFAFISQVPFALLFNVKPGYPLTLASLTATQNIFFTLFAGALACVIFDRIKKKYFGYIIVTVISLIAWYLMFDYLFYGVWMIFLFHRYYGKLKPGFPYFLILVASLSGYFYAIESKVPGLSFIMAFLQPFSLFAFWYIGKYDGTQGSPKWKYWFYAFYPAHMLLLWGLWMALIRPA